MQFNSLRDWLAWQETLHPKTIDLGLERVKQVLHALRIDKPGFHVFSIA
ncbi:MAG: bifunctional folylpolyglutamate synthase/dihydrofolate synthase, partial [Gammaproteobacteria bacterium]|nr:bifunctional folylpolyglutamate synthase/dihydrofolate synthase [Gammaproteobacteria bacterium]